MAKRPPHYVAQRLTQDESDRFAWRTHFIDMDGPWGWEQADPKTILSEIIPKLQDAEALTWGEIVGRVKIHHFIELSQLSSEAQQRFAEVWSNRYDTEKLFSFRLNGLCRVWGIKQGVFFQVLWWDPRHTVYPVSKSHT